MIHRAWIGLAVIPFLVAAAGQEDRDKIQGTWVCEAAEVAGFSGSVKGDGSGLVGIRFDGDHYVEFNGTTNSPRGGFKLDPAKTPKHMDLTNDPPLPPLQGERTGKITIPCIYELNGDTLKVCMGSEERPRSFKSSRERPDMVLVYKRSRRLP